MSWADQMKRRFNIAGNFLSSGPNIGNLYNATSAIFGGHDPEDPYVNVGIVEAPLPGNVSPRQVAAAKKFADEANAVKQIGELGFADQLERTIQSQARRDIVTQQPVTPRLAVTPDSYIARGYVQGNEVTPVTRVPVSELGLTTRTVEPVSFTNPITDEASLQAAKDYVAEPFWKTTMDPMPITGYKVPLKTTATTATSETPKLQPRKAKTLTKKQQKQRADHEKYQANKEAPQSGAQKAAHQHTRYIAGDTDGRIASGRKRYKAEWMRDSHEKLMEGTDEWSTNYQKLYKSYIKNKDRGLDQKRISELEDQIKTYQEQDIERTRMGIWAYDKLHEK